MSLPRDPDGSPRREVVLREYDAEWPLLAERWIERITEVAGDRFVEIHHIGSTSVPGMFAKPIIDLMPGLRSFEEGFAVAEAMETLGFEARGEHGLPRRHYFHREDVHVHAWVVGEGQWHDQLAFRDYLRGHAGARAEYADLKRQLQRSYRFDPIEFSNQKSDFVAGILARAGRESG